MFGTSNLLSRCRCVCGEVSLESSHSVISGRLYVKPSAARTGSVISSPVNVVSQSSMGGRVRLHGETSVALGELGEDCMLLRRS
jgi:hypothetical protein